MSLDLEYEIARFTNKEKKLTIEKIIEKELAINTVRNTDYTAVDIEELATNETNFDFITPKVLFPIVRSTMPILLYPNEIKKRELDIE